MNIDGLVTDSKELPANLDNSCGAQRCLRPVVLGRFLDFRFRVEVRRAHAWPRELGLRGPELPRTPEEKVLDFLGAEFETAAKKVGLACELTRCLFHREMDQGGCERSDHCLRNSVVHDLHALALGLTVLGLRCF